MPMVDPLLLLGAACAGAAASAAASALLHGDQVRRMRTKLVQCRMALVGLKADDEQQRVLCRGMMDDPSRMAIRFDRHGKAIFVSPSCATITGYAPEQLLGDQVFPLLHALDEPALRAAVHAGTGLPRVRLARLDGQTIWLSVRAVPVPEDNGLLLTLTDITQSVRTEDGLSDARNQLDRMAMRDSLTGLPNRACFIADAARLIGTGQIVALFFIDLDRFKPMNDVHGHLAGDEILREIGTRLGKAHAGDLSVARLGADEFALLARVTDGDHQLTERARLLLQSIQEPIRIGSTVSEISATIGIAVSQRDGIDANALLRAADLAMAQGKQAGGGCYRFFEPRMGKELEQQATLKRELPQAIETGQVLPYFQPLVRMDDAAIVGFEVLARWHHPTRGVLPPMTFLPLVEEIGLSAAMFKSLLTRSCIVARDWPHHVKLSVNISPHELRDEGLPDAVRDILDATGFDGCRVEIEITENALVDDPRVARETLGRLRALGLSVALDDFGTGFSSLYHLRELPFDKVKIDKSFMRALDTDAESARYVAAIIGLCHALDLEMTAEGIETEATMQRLRELGCIFGQGYLFGHPMPAEDAGRMLTRNKTTVMAAE